MECSKRGVEMTFLDNTIITFLHSMEKKSTKVDFSPISCKKEPFYTRIGHFLSPFLDIEITICIGQFLRNQKVLQNQSTISGNT